MENLRTTKCQCGIQICGKHMKPPFIKPEELGVNLNGFYGNRVKKFIKAVCECGREYIAYLKPSGNGYDVVDMALKKDLEGGEAIEEEVQRKEEGIAPEPTPPDIENMTRVELLQYAKQVGVEGKIATLKTEELKEKIKRA